MKKTDASGSSKHKQRKETAQRRSACAVHGKSLISSNSRYPIQRDTGILQETAKGLIQISGIKNPFGISSALRRCIPDL